MAKVFVIKGKYEGKSIMLMGRYKFVDGVHLEEDDDTAKMKSTVLCTFYPCEMMDHEAYLSQKDANKSQPAKPAPAASTAPPAGVVPTASVSTKTQKDGA